MAKYVLLIIQCMFQNSLIYGLMTLFDPLNLTFHKWHNGKQKKNELPQNVISGCEVLLSMYGIG